MTATSSTAPVARGGAQKNHDSLINMAHDWFRRNQSVHPRAGQELERFLKLFTGACEEVVGQLEEPGFPSYPHENLFSEQEGLSREQAETIVLFYIDELLAFHAGTLADDIETWLKKTMERGV